MSDIEIIKPFGPSIVKIKMPKEMVDEMNEYSETIIKNNEKSKNLDHGDQLIGKVKQEFLLEIDFMKKIKWAEFLGSAVYKWVGQETNNKIKHFELIKSWIVRQFQNDYNPVHYHSGHISGVGYLKVPKNLGTTGQKSKKTNENGKLQLIHGSVNLFSQATHLVEPKVGDFILFPNYLMHTVYPFTGTNEERRSVSFNAKLHFEVFNL
tara:strand:+ start:1301 stop:1924 length:624 start_codon:yes stop_codon:yes gene_type:complete